MVESRTQIGLNDNEMQKVSRRKPHNADGADRIGAKPLEP